MMLAEPPPQAPAHGRGFAGTDLRVHFDVAGVPACGAGEHPAPVTRMTTEEPAGVTCSSCLAGAAIAAATTGDLAA